MNETGPRVRPAAVAGLFYPADAGQLREAVQEALAGAGAAPSGAPKAVIAPHAGYVYSGPVAASAYAQLAGQRGVVRRVVLLGPAHRTPLAGVAVSGADAWTTPLGQLPVDSPGRDALLALGSVVVDDGAHRQEHSLEVHLPFVQLVLGDVAILPLVAGGVPAGEVAEVLEAVWDGPETAIVVSSDLSHYHDHDTAVGLDRATAAAIVARRPEGVGLDRACGAYAVRGMLVAAQRHRMDVQLLDLRTSGDTAGPMDRVVGYGAFALSEGQDGSRALALTEAESEVVLDLAVRAIRTRLAGSAGSAGSAGDDSLGHRHGGLPPVLLQPSGVFVTLEVAGALNGCVGSVEPLEPLATAVPRLALAAAFEDPRLPALSLGDWDRLRIKVSLLSPLEAIAAETEQDVIDRLRPGIDGLMLAAGRRRATFLPVMWNMLPEPAVFVRHLMAKAGFPPAGWPPGMEAWTYTTIEFGRTVR